MTFLVGYCFIFSLSIFFGDGTGPIVNTTNGPYEGIYEISRDEQIFESFFGIRYGYVPERFQESKAIEEQWDEVKSAKKLPPVCAQTTLRSFPLFIGEEDCLFLNVYTPKSDDQKRSVIVFIHGGGYVFGSSIEYGGKYLVDQNVVLVTINYRLGVLGYLGVKHGGLPGNVGSRDQILALRWVQENIEYFGGDKHNVTIAGQYSGGAAVTTLMLSPLGQGLFNRVFAMSGTVLAPFGFTESVWEETEELGIALGCSNLPEKFVNCLKEQPLEKLVAAQRLIYKWPFDIIKFIPSLEKDNNSNSTAFLEDEPLKILESGNYRKVPLLVTTTKDEGIQMISGLILNDEAITLLVGGRFDDLAPYIFLFKNDKQLSKIDLISEKVRKYYFGENSISKETETNLTNLYTDTIFVRTSTETVKLASETGQPVYNGLFNYERKDGWSTVTPMFVKNPPKGVSHSEDLSYIFSPNSENCPFQQIENLKNEEDIQFSKRFVKLITDFAKTGIPSIPFGNEPSWPIISPKEHESYLKYLNIDGKDKVTFLLNPFNERLKFWNNLVNGIETYDFSKFKDEL